MNIYEIAADEELARWRDDPKAVAEMARRFTRGEFDLVVPEDELAAAREESYDTGHNNGYENGMEDAEGLTSGSVEYLKKCIAEDLNINHDQFASTLILEEL